MKQSNAAMLEREVAAQPGYVRMVLQRSEGKAQARALCRKFATLCREESARRGMVVVPCSDPAARVLEEEFALATAGVCRGFRLAVVARGSASADIHRMAAWFAARREAVARGFPSEHQAARWLMA